MWLKAIEVIQTAWTIEHTGVAESNKSNTNSMNNCTGVAESNKSDTNSMNNWPYRCGWKCSCGRASGLHGGSVGTPSSFSPKVSSPLQITQSRRFWGRKKVTFLSLILSLDEAKHLCRSSCPSVSPVFEGEKPSLDFGMRFCISIRRRIHPSVHLSVGPFVSR